MLVLDRQLMGRVMGLRELDSHVHEDASVVLIAFKKLLQGVGNGEQLIARLVAPVPPQHLAERLLPPPIVPAQHLEHERVLAVEMVIERRLRHSHLGQDALQSDRVEALAVEQIVGRKDESFSRRAAHGCSAYWVRRPVFATVSVSVSGSQT